MIWALVVTYLLAGATIARMVYEFDVFSDPDGSVLEQIQNREREIWICVVLVFVWPLVPAWALWNTVTSPKR
jgi:hypothetical protein